MRVLATWDPADLPSPIETSAENLVELGMMPRIDSRGWFSKCWDPREDAPKIDSLGLSWAQETPRGIQLKRHPEIAILDYPEEFEMVDRWRSSTSRDLTPDHYDTWSNFAIECWLTMTGATRREEVRQVRGGENGDS
ncbi:MAG: hypothetical protein CBC38_00820 [Gammaproteobacteria bacterium TMED78]|nr:MAG: hypothetical protein CBC38_00820 [Gammaproteobacteria bacterium TMED78]|tara:strand:+ start:9235 stop:9645 length:411 start_codon:yes stop_codon:yes gene_type:complete